MHAQRFDKLFDVLVIVVAAVMALDLRVPDSPEPAGFARIWAPAAAYLVTLGNLWLLWSAKRRWCAATRATNDAPGGAASALLLGLCVLPFAASTASQATWSTPSAAALYGLTLAAIWMMFRALRQGTARAAEPDEPDEADEAARRAITASEPGAMALAAAFAVSAVIAAAYPRGGLVLYAAIPIFRVMLREIGNANPRGGPGVPAASDAPTPSPR